MNNIADVTERLKIKKKASLWLRLRWVLLGVLIVALIGAGIWLVRFSNVFVVKEVKVSQLKILTRDVVLKEALVPMGTQLVVVETDSIRERVAALPAVEDVEVRTVWPSQVVIKVRERKAVYQLIDGQWYLWVDANGVIFHRVNKRVATMPVVSTTSNDARILKDISTIVKATSQIKGLSVKEVTANGTDKVILTIERGKKIIWGSADRSALKARVVTTLLKVDAGIYDVSAPETPITHR